MLLALMGHMGRAMLERYSHIRMSAKREAVKALSGPKEGRIDEEHTVDSTSYKPPLVV